MMMGLGGGRVIWETTVWPERLNRKKSLSDNLTFKPGPMSPQHFTAVGFIKSLLERAFSEECKRPGNFKGCEPCFVRSASALSVKKVQVHWLVKVKVEEMSSLTFCSSYSVQRIGLEC